MIPTFPIFDDVFFRNPAFRIDDPWHGTVSTASAGSQPKALTFEKILGMEVSFPVMLRFEILIDRHCTKVQILTINFQSLA